MKSRDLHRSEERHDTIKSHLIDEHRHDPYKARGKHAGITVCPSCSAVHAEGRWTWADTPPAHAERELCSACHRIKDNYPAGEITLSGAFIARHGDEIIRLARNVEDAEKSDHPLQRIMGIANDGDRIVITTTDIHLPRRIGHAIEKAYKGELDTNYDEAGYFVRMRWQRDA